MRKIHIANTDVEFELSGVIGEPLDRGWPRQSLCLQLQFLPLLYGEADDLVAVTSFPSADYLVALQQLDWRKGGVPEMILLAERIPYPGADCLSWGPSQRVLAWAAERQIHYSIPSDWEVIRLVNSKVFSFRYSTLAGAALLHDASELRTWCASVLGNKVIKTSFGLSGKGHRRVDEGVVSPQMLSFCTKEWQQGRPLIGEPWLDKICDFSTQWMIHREGRIELVGATVFETDLFGVYQGTVAGPEELLFPTNRHFLQQHKKAARAALQDMAAMGFFGPVGVDALIYRCPHSQLTRLYPIVEINGRQTMSSVALRLQQKHWPERCLHLSFETVRAPSSLCALLPQALTDSDGKKNFFQKQLSIQLK